MAHAGGGVWPGTHATGSSSTRPASRRCTRIPLWIMSATSTKRFPGVATTQWGNGDSRGKLAGTPRVPSGTTAGPAKRITCDGSSSRPSAASGTTVSAPPRPLATSRHRSSRSNATVFGCGWSPRTSLCRASAPVSGSIEKPTSPPPSTPSKRDAWTAA